MKNLNVNRPKYAKFIPARDATDYKKHSLVSSTSNKDYVSGLLKEASEDLEIAFRNEIRKIASDPKIQVEIGDFDPETPSSKGLIQAGAYSDFPQNRALMLIDNKAFGSLLELFFGSSPAVLDDQNLESKKITNTEKDLASNLFDLFQTTILKALGKEELERKQHWIEKLKDEEVLWTEIKVSSEDGWGFSIHMAWPVEITDEVEEEEERPEVDFSEALEKILMNVELTLKSVVAKTSINITDIANLKKGDILPISLPNQVNAKSGDNTIISGNICEHNHRLALKIEHNSIGVQYE